MPQFRRKVPFSGKQKREQLKAKKEKKRMESQPENMNAERNASGATIGEGQSLSHQQFRSLGINHLIAQGESENYLEEVEHIGGKNKYNLKFKKNQKDSKNEEYHHTPLKNLSIKELECNSRMFFPDGLDYPRRPHWDKTMDKVHLDQWENRNFRLFCENIDHKFKDDSLSLFELNLETWRQLWRVVEMSDILLIIVDARYAPAQFPPYLYEHLVEQNKKVILVMNKCDIVPPPLILAWQDYFTNEYPKLIVLPFSSLEGKEMRKTRIKMAAEGTARLIDACQSMVDEDIDLNSWREKVEEDQAVESNEECEVLRTEEMTLEEQEKQQYDIQLTLGTIGHPNVGKSSLINALMGKSVVSVSRTPGHTKYFQTIFMTNDIRICDCPGLVFPSVCSKEMQVVVGSYPVSQVRDPISTVGFIAERIDIPATLKLTRLDPEYSEEGFEWTPYFVAEAYAKKRSYRVRTKGGRADVYRAANELLRFTLAGVKNLVVALIPPFYEDEKEKYNSDSRIENIKLIQGVGKRVPETRDEEIDDSEDEDCKNDGDLLTSRREENESETESEEEQKMGGMFAALKDYKDTEKGSDSSDYEDACDEI